MPQLKPICVDCLVAMPVIRMGVAVVETFQDPPRLYQVWMADRHACPVCGKRVLVNFGDHPVLSHYDEKRLADWVQNALLDPTWVHLWKERITQEVSLQDVLATWLQEYAERKEKGL